MNDFDLGRAMQTTVAEPPPSQVIDLDLAVTNGRQRIRRRRIATGVAAGVLALALPVGAVVAVTARDTPRPAPGQQTTGASSAPPVAAPQRFDPLRLRLRPGWAPEDILYRRQEVTLTSQTLHYVQAANGNTKHELTATLYSAGVTPPEIKELQPRQAETTRLPGPLIGGRQSTWVDPATLTWQWATNASAVVRATGFGSFDDDRAVAARFATALRTDAEEAAVRMPFSVARPPEQLRLVRTEIMSGTEFGPESYLFFSDRDDGTDPNGGPRGVQVAVERSSNTDYDSKRGGRPDTTVDGHPAIVRVGDAGGKVTLFNVDGHRLTVLVHAGTRRYVDQARALALCRSIRPIADAKRWTTTPVA